jgi:hypothetical protein
MSLKLGKPKMPTVKLRKDKDKDKRQAQIQDADKTEGKDRHLVHGDGESLGLDNKQS